MNAILIISVVVWAGSLCEPSLTASWHEHPFGRQGSESSQRAHDRQRLYPVDESHLDPSFAEFKGKLLKAAQERDAEFLRSILADKVMAGFEEPSSPEQVIGMFESEGGQLWKELRDTLRLGATRFGEGWCAPYVFTKFSSVSKDIERAVITGRDVRVRAAPKSTAATVEILSYDVVGMGPAGWQENSPTEEIEGETYPWQQIVTPSGKFGYVWGKYVRSPLDVRFCFHKYEGQWKLDGFAVGD